jgi:hypothetical protein
MKSSSFTASKITGARGRAVVVDNIVIIRPILKTIGIKGNMEHKKTGFLKLAGFRQKPNLYFISSQNSLKTGPGIPFKADNTLELSDNFPCLKTNMGLN